MPGASESIESMNQIARSKDNASACARPEHSGPAVVQYSTRQDEDYSNSTKHTGHACDAGEKGRSAHHSVECRVDTRLRLGAADVFEEERLAVPAARKHNSQLEFESEVPYYRIIHL